MKHESSYTDLIGASELNVLLRDPTCRIVDCRFELADPARGRALYRAGHIHGAVFADLDKDLAGPVGPQSGRHPLPDVEAFRQKLCAWGIANDSQVVAYDQGNGASASRFWWMLRWLGHERVAVLDGGLGAWEAFGGELDADEPPVARTEYIARPDAAMVATTQEIEAMLAAGEPCLLVDARDERRFRGEVEPIDPVAGRIPGSVNLPFQRNLDSSGQWRSSKELREIWRCCWQDGGTDLPIALCGSGVTACHLILAAKRAGLPMPRLYVGSWSEWIRDPNRPIALG